jgi:hypothetical protein
MRLSLWLLLLLIFFATAKYTLGPIFIRFKNTASVDPTFHEITDEHARALFPQNFFALIHQFEALGFSLVCHLSTSMTTNTHSMISLLVNRTTKTFATVACIRSLNAEAPTVVNYFEFTADFEDGWQLDTTNSSTVGVFYKPPRKTQIKVPHLKDPNAQYQVHLHLMKQRNVPACLPEPGTEKARFINSVKESVAEQAELGFYFLDETKQCYRPTWRGAYRATYRLLWPFKQIHQRRQEQEGRRIAVEALRSK